MTRNGLCLAAWIAATASAQAATGTITFSGSVNATCSLTVDNAAGVMTPSSTLQVLSSKNSGGVPGRLTLTTTGGVVVSLDAPSAMAHPSDDLTPTTWVPTYSMSGVQTIPDASTPTTISSAGSGRLDVHLTGTKTGTNSFASGNYSATVTVRCEP